MLNPVDKANDCSSRSGLITVSANDCGAHVMRMVNALKLTEIAEKLNLSVSTVSRALTRPELVAEGTRQRVLEAAETLAYRPNSIARSLREGKTRTLGLIVSDIQNPFYAAVVKSVEGVAARHGYSTVVCNADEDPRKETDALHLLSEMKVAGIIHGSTGANLSILQALSRECPIVDIDRVSGLEDADTVLVDNYSGARLAALHLLGLGHTRLAVIAGPQHLTTGRDRLEGFREALSEAGVPLPDTYVKLGDFREGSGYEAATCLLGLASPPTALFVANNEMAAGALSALRKHAVPVPRVLSLVTFDDVRWAKYIEPPLTVVAQPTRQLGSLAAALLFERLAGRQEAVRRVLQPTLVVRGSSAPPEAVAADES